MARRSAAPSTLTVPRCTCLVAMTHHQGLVVGQTDVAAKTNEIPRFTELLDGLYLRTMIITRCAGGTHEVRTAGDGHARSGAGGMDQAAHRGGHDLAAVRHDRVDPRRSVPRQRPPSPAHPRAATWTPPRSASPGSTSARRSSPSLPC